MSEWGPWIEHDGKGCPCRGQYVQGIYENGIEFVGIAGSHPEFQRKGGGSWNWANRTHFWPIIRYRIRKPRGLTILEELLVDLPAPSAPKVEVGA